VETQVIDVDPADTKKILTQALGRAETPVGFLLGAGCSCSIKNPNGTALIPAASDFTTLVFGELEKSTVSVQFAKLRDHCLLPTAGLPSPHVELALSRIRGLREIVGASRIFDLDASDLDSLDEAVCRIIESVVGPNLPQGETSHSLFARWISDIDRHSGVSIFTTNYDLLIEQALERARAPFFDGFAGADEPFFDLSALDMAMFPNAWSRVWKLHGSVNWRQRDKGVIRSRQATAAPLVFPSHLKYAESRRLPYLAMRDHLRSLLKSRCVFITCGYSFSDAHLNEDITYGLGSNSGSVCFALLFGHLSGYPEVKPLASRHPNLNVLALDGGLLRGREVRWTGTAMPLGDFSQFARFLVDEVMGEASI
jgi:hypothetical protein